MIDSTWLAQYSHLDPDLFTSPKLKTKPKPKQNKGPNKRVWHAATKDFRMTESDIFTMDINLASITTANLSSPASLSTSSTPEYESPKKRKAAPGSAPAPVKRRRYARPSVVELAEVPVVQSRAGRVVRRTDKAKDLY